MSLYTSDCCCAACTGSSDSLILVAIFVIQHSSREIIVVHVVLQEKDPRFIWHGCVKELSRGLQTVWMFQRWHDGDKHKRLTSKWNTFKLYFAHLRIVTCFRVAVFIMRKGRSWIAPACNNGEMWCLSGVHYVAAYVEGGDLRVCCNGWSIAHDQWYSRETHAGGRRLKINMFIFCMSTSCWRLVL